MKLWCSIIKRMEIIMWTHVYPSWKININSKIGGKRSFYYKTKASMSFIPMRRMSYGSHWWKERRFLCESVFIPNELWFWKMVEREAFHIKPMHQCHLSQWGEWVYCSQWWKEKRLLYESLFIQIDKWTLIVKNSGWKGFFYEIKT